MTAPAAPINLDNLLTEWPLGQGETRQLKELIGNVLVDAHANSGTDLDPKSFQLALPASLLPVLVELLAPIADNPHASTDLDFTLHVLKALTDRLDA